MPVASTAVGCNTTQGFNLRELVAHQKEGRAGIVTELRLYGMMISANEDVSWLGKYVLSSHRQKTITDAKVLNSFR
jgi:hypothetical protein